MDLKNIYSDKNQKGDDKMEDLYERHKTLELKIPEEVFIIGCGGTGTWLGIECAMVGVKNINIFDDDTIENHNRSRLPYPESWVGKRKTDALKEFIKNIRPECNVYVNEGIRSDIDLIAITGKLVFDCNDDPNVQKMIFNHCKKNKFNYIGVGCNANHVSVISDLDKIWLDEGKDTYQVTPMYLVPPMVSSLCAIWNVVHGNTNLSYLKEMKNLFGIQKEKKHE